MMSQPAAGLDDRLPLQDRDRLVVFDIAVADHAVMAVRRERVERHVAQHAELGQGLFQRGDRAADEIAGIDRVAAFRILEGVRHRRKDSDRRDTELGGLAGGIDQCRDRQAEDIRHRRDRRLAALVMDKDRPDQVARRQHCLGDQLARPCIAPVAAQPGLRIGGEGRQERCHGIHPEGKGGTNRRYTEICGTGKTDNLPADACGPRYARNNLHDDSQRLI